MPQQPQKLSVSSFISLLQEVVETNFVSVNVEGEVSNFAAPTSGHWYFTLKDSRAQLKCVMFRNQNRLMRDRPKDGDMITVSGSVTVYSSRGELQIVVASFDLGGQGTLQAAYEALKTKLAQEGLFAAERKKVLPYFPRKIGLITSAKGAALQDILSIIKRRAPSLRMILYPVSVQGAGSADEIAEGIQKLNTIEGMDVLIVGRGGGSIEDLWSFNEEIVARAIANSSVPIISAVGHETDFTISDFVADVRAATPSAAAEIVAKHHQELEAHLDHLFIRLLSRMDQTVGFFTERLTGLEGHLKLLAREFANLPASVKNYEDRLYRAMAFVLRCYWDKLASVSGRLDTLSPLSQLKRGAVIASRLKDGKAISSVKGLSSGDRIWLRFSDGRVETLIQKIEE